ncbi:hypothetical protein BGW80DRAFT_1258229 [Lactifluus volemus]|nr:hypothetical protein BGW80DRAFT_1258229 [Lactifluus volemus]
MARASFMTNLEIFQIWTTANCQRVPAWLHPRLMLSREKTSRMERRREINELTMRMVVGAVGGLLETRSASSVFSELAASRPDEHSEHEPGDTTSAVKMWDEWGNKIEAWTTVKQIADQAVGRVVSSSLELVKLTLSPTPILWAHVCSSWGDQRVSRDLRKAWIQQISSRTTGEDQQDRDLDDDSHTHADDIVEAVKTDPYLDTHEQRLLGCIVDSVSMPTSFAQVHLPAHTIDSVRTIVSLPLLHPTAFQEGILKEHSMTGCLLFARNVPLPASLPFVCAHESLRPTPRPPRTFRMVAGVRLCWCDAPTISLFTGDIDIAIFPALPIPILFVSSVPITPFAVAVTVPLPIAVPFTLASAVSIPLRVSFALAVIPIPFSVSMLFITKVRRILSHSPEGLENTRKAALAKGNEIMGGPALAWVIKVMSWAVASTVDRGYDEDLEEFIGALPSLLQSDSSTSLTYDGSVAAQALLFGLGILPSSSTLSPLHTHSTLSASAHLPIHPIDPRTGVCIVDSRSVRYASSSKINILVLNRAPLSAAAWSYYYNVSARSNE